MRAALKSSATACAAHVEEFHARAIL